MIMMKCLIQIVSICFDSDTWHIVEPVATLSNILRTIRRYLHNGMAETMNALP